MSRFRSLQARLALAIGASITVMWVAAALYTGNSLRHEMDEVFDAAMSETAQRILPIAALEIMDRDEEGINEEIDSLRVEEEYLSYVVRDAQNRVLMQSRGAEPADFPPFKAFGFLNTPKHRIYYDGDLGGAITIAMAEPLEHRAKIAGEAQFALTMPLLVLIPISIAGVLLLVPLSLRAVLRFRDALASRGARDLSPLHTGDLPTEIVPVAVATNLLLERLNKAFQAERSFASNAAHELRTPVAAALAQAQRLIAETKDTNAAARAGDIEASLKRLNRLSEKLIQLARAEGGRLRTGTVADIRPVLKMVASDFDRMAHSQVVDLDLPGNAVNTDIDPDAVAILFRNLVENALKHGSGARVEVRLAPDGKMHVINEGPVIAAEDLQDLTSRFARGATKGDGSGLGLSIVKAIIDGVQSEFTLRSPATGRSTGFEVITDLS